MPSCPEGEDVKGTSCLHDRPLYGSSPTACVANPTSALTSLSLLQCLKCMVSSPGDPLEGLQPAQPGFSPLLFLSQEAGQGISFLFCFLNSLGVLLVQTMFLQMQKKGKSSSRSAFDISTDAFYPRWIQTAFYSAIPLGW